MKNKKKNLLTWRRLDNSAKIFPLSASKKYSTVFRLSVLLNEDIKPETLENAVIETLEKYKSLISHKKYIRYAIYQLLIVLITLISLGIIFKITSRLVIIAISISVLNLIISLILSFKDIKEDIIRKFHM